MNAVLVGFGSAEAPPLVVVFQYNPETLTRAFVTAEPTAIGPVTEILSFTMPLDALDLSPQTDATTGEFGILPALTALEELTEAPRRRPPTYTFLIWGPHRVLPVQVAGLTVRETEFNPQLAPVRAEVDVVLHVLHAPADGAPDSARRAWQEQRAARMELLKKLPGRVPDYVERILK